AAALSFAVVGCRHKPVNVTPLESTRTGNPGEPGPGDKISGGPGGMGDEASGAHPLADPGTFANWPRNESFFEADTIHFAYDSSVIRAEDKSKVAHVADYLKGKPDAVEV